MGDDEQMQGWRQDLDQRIGLLFDQSEVGEDFREEMAAFDPAKVRAADWTQMIPPPGVTTLPPAEVEVLPGAMYL